MDADRCVMDRSNIPRHYKMLSPDDRRTFDRWLKVNVVFGAILVIGLAAMAVAGSYVTAPHEVAVAAGGKTTDGAASQLRHP
jgi:hypothetical protein